MTKMIPVALTIMSADGLGCEQIEMYEFTEDAAADWLVDNVWETVGDYDSNSYESDMFAFIEIRNEAEGIFVFTTLRELV